MSKGKLLNVIARVGDEDYTLDPRSKFSLRKTKKMNIERNNKYNASKIDLPCNIQS